MNDYNKALEFWNNCFNNLKGEKYTDKFVDSEVINEIFKTYINNESQVLDFGCGSGWGLFEIALTTQFSKGIGIDQSENSIKYANESVQLSNFKNLEFICGDHHILDKYTNTFDFVFSTNLLDVIPNEVTIEILDSLYNTTKKDGYLLICLNPVFTEQELKEVLKMEKRDNYYYKDNILRCNFKTIEEWEKLFSLKFTLLKSSPFKLMTTDKYERRLYLLKK